MMLPNSVFCFDHFVAGMANGTSKSTYCNGRVIFSQGDDSDSLFYVRDGRIKCTFVSSHGKERIVAILKTGQFFGEGCIIGHAKRAMTATAMPSCAVTQIEKITMLRLLCEEPDLAEKFISSLIGQSLGYESELLDHLFSSAEERLARTLLLLSEPSIENAPEATMPRITQETLAQIVGTTRSRINYFMNKFRRAGLIENNDGETRVRRSLLRTILQENI